MSEEQKSLRSWRPTRSSIRAPPLFLCHDYARTACKWEAQVSQPLLLKPWGGDTAGNAVGQGGLKGSGEGDEPTVRGEGVQRGGMDPSRRG